MLMLQAEQNKDDNR